MINFWLSQANWCKNFFPLAETAKNQGLDCNINLIESNKWNTCFSKENFNIISSFCEKNKIKLSINNHSSGDIDFFIEGNHRNNSNAKKKVIITENSVFSMHLQDKKALPRYYDSYIADVDHVIFSAKIFAKKYDCLNSKNLYHGVPQFDTSYKLSKKDIISLLHLESLQNKKIVVIILPKLRDAPKVDFIKLYAVLRSLDFCIFTKTRGKDVYANKFILGDYHFNDFTTYRSWSPYTTSLLLQISNLAINFGSTATIECIANKTPYIDFKIKEYESFDFLNEKSVSHVMHSALNYENSTLVDNIIRLLNIKEHTFNILHEKLELPVHDKICKNILNSLL